MEATNRDFDWARRKLRWLFSRIATRLELEAEQNRGLAARLRAWG